MRRNSRWLAGLALVTLASAGSGQELPHPAVLPGPPPAAVAPRAAELAGGVSLGGRPPYPPPLPAVVDPRTGAWRQVYASPEECVGPGPAVLVGGPCPRCGDQLRHPFHGRLRAALLGRHAQSCQGAPDQPAVPDGVAGPANLAGVEMLPPRVPAERREEGSKGPGGR